MTATLPEPPPARAGAPRRGASAARRHREARRRAVRPRLVRAPARAPVPAALAAAGVAFGVGFAACAALAVLGWAVGGPGPAGLGDAVRAGGMAYAAGHLAPITLPGGTFRLAPLGLTVLVLLLCYRAGRWAAHASACDSLPRAGRLTVVSAGGYAVAVAVVALRCTVAGAYVSPAVAFLAALLLGALGFGAGVVRGAGLVPTLLAAVPPVLRRALPAAAATCAALALAAGVVLTAALALHLPDIAAMAAGITNGAADGFVLLLVGLLYLPTLLLWCLAYLAGPGVVLGGAAVTPFDSGGGLAPAFPPLAALPQGLPAYAPLVLLLPVLAGAMGGAVLTRRAARRGDRGGIVLLPEVALTAGLTAVVVAVLSWAASGPLGDGRLAQVGPTAWLVGLAVGALALAGCAAWVVLAPLASGAWAAVTARRPERHRRTARPEGRPSRLSRLRAHLYHDGTD